MTAHLRVRHYRLTFAVAVTSAGLFALALRSRVVPPVEAWPSAPVRADVLQTRPDAFAPTPIGFEIVAMGEAGTGVRLRSDSPVPAPDLLLYWTPDAVILEDLPLGAHLLGSVGRLGPEPLPLPAPALAADGSLLLYSGAHRRVVARAALQAPEPR